MQKPAQEEMKIFSNIKFCVPCVGGKHHRNQFPRYSSEQSDNPLDLVHSNVYGNLGTKSFGAAEYF